MMFRHSALILALFLSPFLSPAQDILVVDDRTSLLSAELEAVLSEKLAAVGITYTTTVDFRSPCNYHYAGLEKKGNDLMLRIRDCDDHVLGAKNMGASITEASGEEQGLLLSFAIRDIISNPGAYTLPTATPAPPGLKNESATPTNAEAQRADTTISN